MTIPWISKYSYYLCEIKRIKKQCGQTNDTTQSGFRPINDTALKSASEDAFGWSDHVKGLMRDTLQSSNATSVSVAITGKWGAGKTSYLTLLKEELKNRCDEFIIIEFNPRRSASASTIQNDFLCQLRGKLSDYDSSIGGYISKYIEALNIIDEKSLFPKLISLTGIDKPEHYKKSIEEVIKSTGKTLIVLIDDLDRLTGVEIMEVLKLVNLNVNFEHSIFISAFDKDYVEKALSAIIINREAVSDESSSIRNYTDKYFTFERPLPSVKPHKLIQYLLYELIKSDNNTEDALDSNQSIISFLSSNLSLIYHCIPTIRDVKRFVNLLMPAYQLRKNDVTFDDFFLLCLLQYGFPETYEKIRCREIVDTNILDNTSQVFRLDASESVPGHKIVSMLFEKYSKDSAYSLNRKHFKSIRHQKAFPLYFYEYDESSICFKDYLEIANPNVSMEEAKEKLKKLTNTGSDTYSIMDLIYDDAVRMTYVNKDSHRRSIELRVSLADIRNDITVGNLLFMINIMPGKDFLIKLGFGEGDSGKTAYRKWLYDLIKNLAPSNGSQRLVQFMTYTINGPQEEALSRDKVLELIRHHMNSLANLEEVRNIDANLFFQYLISSGVREDDTILKLDSDCFNIFRSVLERSPEHFYFIFFNSFTNPNNNYYKVSTNLNETAYIVNNNNIYQNLANVLQGKSDITSKAIVHFYNNYYSKGVNEWKIEYPKGFNPGDYKSNHDLMKALFEHVLE
ncbi:MAG: KAP family NTPase [Muribaculaceae bacterium]|nr:KAP family NTPase [Muribaculaceae bacterium]